MSNYAKVRVKGQLKDPAAKMLFDLCLDWTFEKPLKAPPEDPLFLQAYELLEDMFINNKNDPDSLKKGILDLNTEFKTRVDDMEFFLDEFLPATLISLTEGWYTDEYTKNPVNLKFDSKSKKIIQTEGTKAVAKADDTDSVDSDECEEVVSETDAEWAAEFGDIIDVNEWRNALARFIELVADLQRQDQVFKGEIHGGEKFLEIENWFDLTRIYFTVLNLEDGFKHALDNKFINKDEKKILNDFDNKFRNYLPENFGADDEIINDPKWIAVCEIAQELNKTFVPKLRK